MLSGSIRTKAAASMNPAPPATKYRSRAWPCLWAVVTIAAPATSAAAATAANAKYANIAGSIAWPSELPPACLARFSWPRD